MMKLISVICFLFLTGWIIPGCCSKIDVETHRQELLSLNQEMRTAHIEGNAGIIISGQGYPYTQVNSGQVTHPTHEDDSERFQNYIGSMNITAWDDLIDPIVTISDDASLATVIYKKHLVMTRIAQPEAEPYEGIYAWQSTYRRTKEGWKQISDIVTTLPEEAMAEELKSLKN
ncbi:MAG: hypothetical protein ABIE07_01245 [Candidatus Zixiibacteriota bacterium]